MIGAATETVSVGAYIVQVLYILTGLYSLSTGVQALCNPAHPARIGTALFWGIFGLIMIGGDLVPEFVPAWVVGALLVVLALLTVTRQVRFGPDPCPGAKERAAEARRIGLWLFVPPLALGLVAFAVAQFAPGLTGLSGKHAGLIGLGGGGLIGILLTLLITRSPLRNVGIDGGRLLQQMGPATLLPLVLGALGTVFMEAGVGKVIAAGIENAIPEGSRLAGVIAYCCGMCLFTVIMGNAFAAFLVITAGIGVPFVIAPGGDPALVAALGMTAGYCGTLMTPMAANFNIIPVAILEMRNQYGVIRSQLPLALTLLAVHIVIMYCFAF